MRLSLLSAVGALCALVAPGLATAGPGLVVGAVEDDVRASTLIEAEARMTAFRVAGFRAVRVTSYWTPGLTQPRDDELRVLRNVGDAGARNGVRVYVTVMSPGSRTTPLTTRPERSSPPTPQGSCEAPRRSSTSSSGTSPT